MEKKMSKGVMIFAWLMIVLNIFILVSSLDYKTLFDCFNSFSKNFVISIILYSIASPVIGVVSGIGLLKASDLMRKMAIAINSLDLLLGIPLFYITLSDIKQYCYTIAYSQIAENAIKLDVNSFANGIYYSIVFVSCAIFGISLLFIFFFTRPKVKAQFK